MVEPRNMFRKGSVASLMEINAPWPFGGPLAQAHSASAPGAAGRWKGSCMPQTIRTDAPWPQMQTRFAFTEQGIGEAIESALEMRSVKSTIVPTPDLIDD
jgi:hypothetical protein